MCVRDVASCVGASKCGSYLPAGGAWCQSSSSNRAVHAGESLAHCSTLRAPGHCEAALSMQPPHLVAHKGDTLCSTSASILSPSCEHCTCFPPLASRNVFPLSLSGTMKQVSWCVQDGSTPLHYAAAFGQTGVIRTLIESGCPVHATDDAKNTPLHLAAGEPFLAAH